MTLAAAEPCVAPADEAMVLSLQAQLESLLFVADEPVTLSQLVQVLGVTPEVVEATLDELTEAYRLARRGIRLQRHQASAQLISAPEAAAAVERFLGLDRGTGLSTAALETLAVIAYRQPLTRTDIEAVRGVNCDGVLRTLTSHGLVETTGRLEGPGRPFLFGTTFQFLQYFGLESVNQLPPLPDGETAGPEGCAVTRA